MTTAEIKLALGSEMCISDTFMVTESEVLQMKIYPEKPTRCKSDNRYASCSVTSNLPAIKQ